MAFFVSAVLGGMLLLLIAMAVGYVWMALYQRNHTGIGAVAGSVSGTAVMLVLILWGVIGMFIVLRRLERKVS